MSVDAPRLLIPTRNRPTALGGVLEFLARFYPGTGVLIADGSSEAYKPANRAAVERLRDSLALDYRPYPEELTYFDRLLDVLQGESDEFFVTGADDDFPMMEVFEEGARYLRERPHCVAAMGASVNLMAYGPDRLRARLNVARDIAGRTPAVRARRYSAWPVATTYAVTRRALLLERCRWARELFLTGFHDYVTGVQDAIAGATKALPSLGVLRTHNDNHSYLRPGSALGFLEQSGLVLRIAERFREALAPDGSLTPDEARREAETLILRRIAILSGGPIYGRQGFTESRVFRAEVVQAQLRLFQELFTEGSALRAGYAEKLAFVAAALRRNRQSTDNRGEAAIYGSLHEQVRGGEAPRRPTAAAAPPPPREQAGVARLLELDPDSLLRL